MFDTFILYKIIAETPLEDLPDEYISAYYGATLRTLSKSAPLEVIKECIKRGADVRCGNDAPIRNALYYDRKEVYEYLARYYTSDTLESIVNRNYFLDRIIRRNGPYAECVQWCFHHGARMTPAVTRAIAAFANDGGDEE